MTARFPEFSLRRLLAPALAITVTACVGDGGPPKPFSALGAVNGISVTETECGMTTDAVWVVVDGQGDCIRYFKSKVMPDANELVYVWFHGDRISGGAATSYYRATANPERQQKDAAWKADFLGRPFIQISRPGVYGSSGNHSRRRTPREVMLMERALNGIQERFRIKSFMLVGQSGGGHLVASLLAYRRDVRCAVITSGVTAVKERYRERGRAFDYTELADSEIYDPIGHVSEVVHDPERWVYVVADPRDQNVPASTQKSYADALKAQGNNVRYIEVERGTGSKNHGLDMVGLEYALKCEANAGGT